MKKIIFAIGLALLLSSCAGARHADVVLKDMKCLNTDDADIVVCKKL